MTSAPPGLLAAVGEVTREGARQEAERELSRPVYAEAEPGLLTRALVAVLRALGRAFDGAAQYAPGGGAGVVALLLLLAATVVAVRLRTGPLARSSRSLDVVGGDRPLTADDHRRRADAAAAEGRWADALRERLRAVVRELEARGVLAVRPGRTARETAEEAGRAAPGLAADLRAAAAAFDEVWYGGRPATPEAEALVRRLDERLRRDRALTGAGR